MATIDASAQSADRRFVKQAMTAPLLDRDHELELAARWRDHQDEAALHEDRYRRAYPRDYARWRSGAQATGAPQRD